MGKNEPINPIQANDMVYDDSISIINNGGEKMKQDKYLMEYYKDSFINNFPFKFIPQQRNYWSIADFVYEDNHRADNIGALIGIFSIIAVLILRFITENYTLDILLFPAIFLFIITLITKYYMVITEEKEYKKWKRIQWKLGE